MRIKNWKNKIVNNSFSFAALKKIIVTICSMVFVSIMSRYLGPELKGEYSTYMAWSSILVIIMQMGFFKLYPNYKRNHPDSVSKDLFFSISMLKMVLLGTIATPVIVFSG